MSRGAFALIVLLCAALVGASVGPGRALAQTRAAPPTLSLVRAPGSRAAELTIDAETLLAVLRLELSTDGVDAIEARAEPSGAEAMVVRWTVHSASRVVVVTVRSSDSREASHALDLSDVVAASRARTLALAIAERVRLDWAAPLASNAAASSEPALAPGGDSAPAPSLGVTLDSPSSSAAAGESLEPADPASAPSLSPTLGPPRGPTLDAAFLTRGYPLANLLTLGGRLQVGWLVASPPALRLVGGLDFTQGRASVALGSVEALSLVASLGLECGFAYGVWSFSLGGRVQLGWLRAAGQSDRATVRVSDGDAALVLVAATGEVAAQVAGPLQLSLGFELGYAVAGVRALADGRRAVGAEELSLAAWFGPGVTFD